MPPQPVVERYLRLDTPEPEAIIRSNVLAVFGWAYSAAAPVETVRIFFDDRLIGETAIGVARPDVAGALGRPEMQLSGFRDDLPIGDVPPGQYTLKLIALDGTGHEFTHQQPVQRDIMPLQLALDAPSERNNTVINDVLEVSGWAHSGAAPIEAIKVFLNDRLVGEAQTGRERADVAEAHAQPEMLHCGFWARLPLDETLLGEYELRLVARDEAGYEFIHRQPLTLVKNPIYIALEHPGQEIIVRDGLIKVQGWAHSHAGNIERVEVFIRKAAD